jgi:tetratricopeptide (TPR) repeat protein
LIAACNPDLFSQDLALQQKARERLKAINEASDKLLAYLASSPREGSQVGKEQSTTQDYGGLVSARKPTGQPLAPPYRPEPASIPSVKSKARSPLLAEISDGVVVLVSLSVLVATGIIGWYIYTSIPSSSPSQSNPTAARSNTSNSLLAKAVAHSQQGELDKAIEDYTSAISFDPKSARAYAGRGDAYYRKGLYGLAIGDYDRAIEISRNPVYLRMRAFACYSRGTELYQGSEGGMGEEFFLRAKSDFDGVLSAKPADVEAYYYRGVATCLAGRAEEGLPDVKRAARLGYKPAQQYLVERGYRW